VVPGPNLDAAPSSSPPRSPAHAAPADRPPAAPPSPRRPGVGWFAAALLPAVLYVVFVVHYGVNSFFNDDWSMVPIVHAALHGHLSWGQLWTQHNEHRVLVPNLSFIAFGWLVALDAKTIMLASAALFVVAYGLFLAVVRAYAGRRPDWASTLLLGAVWFSLSDVESTLLAYQITWYFVVFFLLVLLALLARPRLRAPMLLLCGVVAVAASYSSLQGLFLWPVGLLCLWRRRGDLARPGRVLWSWALAGSATAALYFIDFHLSEAGGGSFRYAFDHPFTAIQFLLAEIGNFVPSLSPGSLHWHEALGLLVVVLAAAVVVASVREVRRDRLGSSTPLPAALLVFALFFDLSSGLGRVNLGLDQALAPRYTMANLLVVLAIAVFAWARLARAVAHSARWAQWLGRLALLLALGAQIGVSTNFGLEQATTIQRTRELGAATVTRLGPDPSAAQRAVVATTVYFSYGGLRPLLATAKADHLGPFAR